MTNWKLVVGFRVDFWKGGYKMDTNDTDIIKILERRKKYHEQQAERMNNAIVALKGTVTATTQVKGKLSVSKSPPWTETIREILKESTVPLDFESLCRALAKRDIPQALEKRNENLIRNIITRLHKNKEIQRVEYGLYRSVKRTPVVVGGGEI